MMSPFAELFFIAVVLIDIYVRIKSDMEQDDG